MFPKKLQESREGHVSFNYFPFQSIILKKFIFQNYKETAQLTVLQLEFHTDQYNSFSKINMDCYPNEYFSENNYNIKK